MKLLQIGAPKSGNFWLYKILKEIQIRSHQKTFIEQHPLFPLAKTWELNYPEQAEIDMIDITDLQTVFRISSIFQMPIKNMEKYVSKTNHVWTHAPICKASESVFKYFDKKIYIIRDPRDRAISAANYFCSPYMLTYFPQPEKNPKKYLEQHFDQLMISWVWHVFDHLKFSRKYSIQFLFFESFLIDFQRELERILKYLKIELSENDKQHLEKELHFSSLKKENPKHLKKGKFGYWKEHLTEEQKEKAIQITKPLLELLDYETLEKSGNFNPSRSFDCDFDFEELKQNLILAQQNL